MDLNVTNNIELMKEMCRDYLQELQYMGADLSHMRDDMGDYAVLSTHMCAAVTEAYRLKTKNLLDFLNYAETGKMPLPLQSFLADRDEKGNRVQIDTGKGGFTDSVRYDVKISPSEAEKQEWKQMQERATPEERLAIEEATVQQVLFTPMFQQIMAHMKVEKYDKIGAYIDWFYAEKLPKNKTHNEKMRLANERGEKYWTDHKAPETISGMTDPIVKEITKHGERYYKEFVLKFYETYKNPEIEHPDLKRQIKNLLCAVTSANTSNLLEDLGPNQPPLLGDFTKFNGLAIDEETTDVPS